MASGQLRACPELAGTFLRYPGRPWYHARPYLYSSILPIRSRYEVEVSNGGLAISV